MLVLIDLIQEDDSGRKKRGKREGKKKVKVKKQTVDRE